MHKYRLNRHHLKSAKLLVSFAVLLFVAKPFLGYSIFNHPHSGKASILVKSFTKRKLEDFENSSSHISVVQHKLADPIKEFLFLLSIIFSAAFIARINITNNFLRKLQLSLSYPEHKYLLNGKLII